MCTEAILSLFFSNCLLSGLIIAIWEVLESGDDTYIIVHAEIVDLRGIPASRRARYVAFIAAERAMRFCSLMLVYVSLVANLQMMSVRVSYFLRPLLFAPQSGLKSVDVNPEPRQE